MKLLNKGLLIFFTAVMLGSLGCRNRNRNISHKAAAQILNLTENNSGETVYVSRGQIFTLSLFDKVDGGYRFDKPKYDTTILSLEKHSRTPPPPNSGEGAPGQDYWQFTTLKIGNTPLKITATRPWKRGGTVKVFSNIIIVK